MTGDQFIQSVAAMKGTEGFVVELASGGLWVKIKTEWYLTLHRAKDSIGSDRRLFETVLEEATDDLRSLFYDDPITINRIDKMEELAKHTYKSVAHTINDFYETHKHLDRKHYAIAGQQSITPSWMFSLAMAKYSGRTVDIKSHMKKHYRDFGISSDPVTSNE
jgi:T4 RnlA family RNA ligase